MSMKVCFTSDLHGTPGLYQTLHKLLLARKPDLLILGGDLFGDGEPPTDPAGQISEVRERFLPNLRAWIAELPHLKIAILGGNHDWRPTADFLASQVQPPIYLLGHQPLNIDGLNLLGFVHTPWTPHGLKDFERLDLTGDPPPNAGGYVFDPETGSVKEVSAEEHYHAHPAMDEMLAQLPPCDPLLFVAHAPPSETRLDELPEVDGAIGSRAIRAFIEARQPKIALHGHVHEAYRKTGVWEMTLGETLCINPGQDPQHLHAVLFDTDDPRGTLEHTVIP